jgi:carbon storage regulator CsrA
MLVLKRKVDDKIHIGNDITVTILRVKGRTVAVGIEAPADVRVLRGALVAAGIYAQQDRRLGELLISENAACRKPR